MIIHCTKKLKDKLVVSKNTEQEATASLSVIGSWHANLIVIERRQCVIFVHDITRYAVFIPCLTKPDFAILEHHFQDVFINSLIKAGLDFELIDKAANLITPLVFDTDCNRSVQGTMRLMSDDIKWGLQYNNQSITELLPYSTSARLSNRPCTIKGQKDCVWPIKAMSELLSTIA
ncbi:DUF6933 domain-containing protein [Psychrobium sp. nBUS_13]|uniref:DUF6933 domain-containing protein n=1 Tax=Psychrobium sp. nBUS_13 TaxID=3395319 RepID=UPI003EBEB2DC